MYVIKESGKKERFMPEKIKRSLLKAGSSNQMADEVLKDVKSKLYDGITTRIILQYALALLKKQDPATGARYDLKRAIMNLGPTGFPFEQYFAEILRHNGYAVHVGKIIPGKLISHEVDVWARKDSKNYLVECKYHNEQGTYTDIKVALYIHSRFLDLQKKFDIPWLATNTKFSDKVVKYAKGVGMKLTSWQYPKGESLSELIVAQKLYPTTILKSVDENTKGKLSKANIMLVLHLIDKDVRKLSKKTGIPESTMGRIVQESKEICDGHTKKIS